MCQQLLPSDADDCFTGVKFHTKEAQQTDPQTTDAVRIATLPPVLLHSANSKHSPSPHTTTFHNNTTVTSHTGYFIRQRDSPAR